MKVVLITDAYPPEIRSASALMFDLATGLRDWGHEVTVLTCYPKYNLTAEDRSACTNGKWKHDAVEDGIRVIRVDAKGVHNTGPIRRGMAFLMLPFLFRRAGAILDQVDAIVHYSPPLTLGVAAVWLKKRFRATYIMNVQDMFPQNAVDLGVLRNKGAITFFRAIEDYCYRNADFITCHSEGNAALLTKKLGDGKKVCVVHNWVDPREYDVAVGHSFRERLGLDGKFVVFFGGVMGFAQDLGTVVECARFLRDQPDIYFLLAGDGVEKRNLLRQAQGLNNVRFQPFVSRKEYPYWVKGCDAGLVTLRPTMKTPVLPSKVLGFMAAKKPWIASVNHESDVRVIAEEASCGLICNPGDPMDMARAVLQLYASPEKRQLLGENGRNHCRREFCKSKALAAYHRLVLQSNQRRRARRLCVRPSRRRVIA